MGARSTGSGTITFGLVTIPFKIYTAAAAQGVSFSTLHKGCGSRLMQQLVCADELKVVGRDDTEKGFEVAKDQFVPFTVEELKELEAERTGQLVLEETVPASTFDMVHIEKTYFIGPDKGAGRAYQLLADTLERNGMIAVGRFATRGKDNLVVLRPYKDGLILHEAFYANEVRDFGQVDLGGTIEFSAPERELADALVEQLRKPAFDASRFSDGWAAKVVAAAQKKLAGEPVKVEPVVAKQPIVDLLEALKASVAAGAAKAEAAVKPGPRKAEPREQSAKKKNRGKSA